MVERKGIVTFKGNPLTLVGAELHVGDEAPDAEVVDNEMSMVKLSNYRDKVCVISAVPSLDTPVCDTETRKFNEKAKEIGSEIIILTISMDLPFAQKRWCGSAGVQNVVTLSDYRSVDFGTKYGVLIKELHLLARTIFVVDKEGVIQYIEVVPEVTDEPDYAAVIDAAKKLV